jgi:fatty-acyl-CoA synthase
VPELAAPAPSATAQLPLWEHLAEPSAARAQLWLRDQSGTERANYALLSRAARSAAAALRGRGVRPGSLVGCVLTNSFDVCAGIAGTWFAGGVVVSLPTIARGMDPTSYASQLTRLCHASGTELVLAESRYAALLDEQLPPTVRVLAFESLRGPKPIEPDPPNPDDPCFVQYSSGSTSDPKGCVLTARRIAAQLTLLGDALQIDPERDRGCIWLPLSHDMGIFGGFLLPWVRGMPLLIGRPERFLASPRTWLSDCAEFGATITVAPNSGLALAVRVARRSPPTAPLSLRACLLGGESVDWRVLSDAHATFGRLGAPLATYKPAYGLAEATLAVTVTRPDESPHVIEVDARALSQQHLEPARDEFATPIVSVGTPLPGVSVRIADKRDIGEIQVNSPALALGYLNDPECTRASFCADGFHTGDLGFIENGELYIAGRFDDMLTVGGRNVYAREVEAQIARRTPVRGSNCAIVEVNREGGRALVCVVELQDGASDVRFVAREIRVIAASTAGLALNECVFLPRGSFPKTPSGKAQRFRCRALAEEGRAATRVAL